MDNLNLFNIFIEYCKKKSNIEIIKDVDISQVLTNENMELFKNEIIKHNNNPNEEIVLQKDIDSCLGKMYVLDIKNLKVIACTNLVPLLLELSDLDWLNIKWDLYYYEKIIY